MVQKINGHFVQNGEWRYEGTVFHPSAPPPTSSAYTCNLHLSLSLFIRKADDDAKLCGLFRDCSFCRRCPPPPYDDTGSGHLKSSCPCVCLFLCHQERTGGAGKCCGRVEWGEGGVSLLYFVSYCKWVCNRSMHILKYNEGWVARKRVMPRVIT